LERCRKGNGPVLGDKTMHYLYRITIQHITSKQTLSISVVGENKEQATDRAFTKLLKALDRGTREDWAVTDISEHPISAALYRAYMGTEK
jgi:hypothetical protein